MIISSFLAFFYVRTSGLKKSQKLYRHSQENDSHSSVSEHTAQPGLQHPFFPADRQHGAARSDEEHGLRRLQRVHYEKVQADGQAQDRQTQIHRRQSKASHGRISASSRVRLMTPGPSSSGTTGQIQRNNETTATKNDMGITYYNLIIR